MTVAAGRVDEFVKDYLMFRGLSSTLKTLEIELKNEKEKGFRVDKMVEQLQSYITSYDLGNLRDYWNFLNSRLFCRLEQRYMSSIRKLEVGLLKFYLVNASQNNKQDKILDFFERMTELLQTQSEFKEWFAFPFVRTPEDNSHYATYFTRQWQDTFLLSLHNFLSVLLQAMQPVLLNFEMEHRQLKELIDQNERLKQQIIHMGGKPDIEGKVTNRNQEIRQSEHSHMELVYDFSSLGGDTAIPEPAAKSPRKFPFVTSSPLSIVKKSDKQTVPARRKDDQDIRLSTMKHDLRQKGSKQLLPVITRQKKTKTTLASQSVPHDSHISFQNLETPVAANQKLADIAASSQRMKKYEGANQERRELLEGGGHQKSKENNRQDVAYSRSASEPATEVIRRSAESRRTVSKSVIDTKLSQHSSSPKSSDVIPSSNSGTQLESVSPLVSATAAMMLSTGMSGGAEELQTFPPGIPATDPLSQATSTLASSDLEAKAAETTDKENPFLLLSQDEYCEHRSAVSYGRFSNSGQYVASVDVDGVVKIWNWSPQAKTAATVITKAAFLSLEWASKSDRWLLLGNRSGNIRLFDVKEMKSFYEATGDTSYPRVVTLCSNPGSPMFVSSATTGRARSGSMGADMGPGHGNKIGKLMLWDLKTMKSDRQLPLEPGPVCINSCAFNHNGQLLLSGGADGVIRLFDVSQQKTISQWEAHSGEIKTVLFSSDYTSCYSLGDDGKLIEWSIHKTKQKLHDLPIHKGIVNNLHSSEGTGNREVPAGKMLALDSDGAYMLSSGETNAAIYKIQKESPGLHHLMDLKNSRSSTMTTVDWSPNIDTKVCLTGHTDGKIIVSTLLSQ